MQPDDATHTNSPGQLTRIFDEKCRLGIWSYSFKMDKEQMIATLEEHIKKLEFGHIDPQVDTKEEEEWSMDSAIEYAKALLERIKVGDEEAFREASDLLSH